MRSAEKKLAYMRQYYAERKGIIKAKVAAWREGNPDKVRRYRKSWAERNPGKVKEWIVFHPEKKREYSKRWRDKNPESNKRWQAENRDRIKVVKAAWLAKNRAAVNKYKAEYETRRSAKDPAFKTLRRLRLRLRLALKGELKCRNTIDLLGCSMERLKEHIEVQFRTGMSWENYGVGGWELDHTKPCSLFDFSKPEQQAECFNFKNLQPLWASENRSKGDFWRVPGDVQTEFKKQ